MPFINWTDDFSVGIPSIDEQHQELIALINGLNEARLKGFANEAVGPTLTRLLAYADRHFAYEEELFERTAFPLAQEHALEHQGFHQRILELQGQLARQVNPSALELMDFMIGWLKQHMVGSDRKYTEHLKAAGIR